MDGNCLFRSISHQVYGTESHHLMVRRKCVEYMSHNVDHFSPSCEALRGSSGSFASYLQTMAKDARDVGEQAWGDYPEIGACAEIYGRRIEIWTYDSVNDGAHVQEHCKFGAGFDRDVNSTSAQESTHSRPIRLSFFKGGHYDSIVEEDGWAPISTAPGRVEDGAIALAKARAPGQLNAAIQASREQAMQAFGGTGTVGMDQVIVRHVMRDSERQHVEESLLQQVQRASEESFRLEQQRFEDDMVNQAVEDNYSANKSNNNNDKDQVEHGLDNRQHSTPKRKRMSNNNSEDDDRGPNNNQRDDAMRNDCKVLAGADNVTDVRFIEAILESGIEKVMQMGLEYFPKGLIKHALRNFQDTKTGTLDVEAAVTWLFADGERFLASNLHLYKDK